MWHKSQYGILFNTLRELKNLKINLQIIASGTHLKSYGLTYKLIENDGFIINEKN